MFRFFDAENDAGKKLAVSRAINYVGEGVPQEPVVGASVAAAVSRAEASSIAERVQYVRLHVPNAGHWRFEAPVRGETLLQTPQPSVRSGQALHALRMPKTVE